MDSVVQIELREVLRWVKSLLTSSSSNWVTKRSRNDFATAAHNISELTDTSWDVESPAVEKLEKMIEEVRDAISPMEVSVGAI